MNVMLKIFKKSKFLIIFFFLGLLVKNVKKKLITNKYYQFLFYIF